MMMPWYIALKSLHINNNWAIFKGGEILKWSNITKILDLPPSNAWCYSALLSPWWQSRNEPQGRYYFSLLLQQILQSTIISSSAFYLNHHPLYNWYSDNFAILLILTGGGDKKHLKYIKANLKLHLHLWNARSIFWS